jgi:hypothetical protein
MNRVTQQYPNKDFWGWEPTAKSTQLAGSEWQESKTQPAKSFNFATASIIVLPAITKDPCS